MNKRKQVWNKDIPEFKNEENGCGWGGGGGGGVRNISNNPDVIESRLP